MVTDSVDLSMMVVSCWSNSFPVNVWADFLNGYRAICFTLDVDRVVSGWALSTERPLTDNGLGDIQPLGQC